MAKHIAHPQQYCKVNLEVHCLQLYVTSLEQKNVASYRSAKAKRKRLEDTVLGWQEGV